MSDHAISNAKAWLESMKEMLAKLGDDDADDAAREEIQDAPLSILVRGGWHRPGDTDGFDAKPEEFEILLSTGGPALRIYGELDGYGTPERADLQWQDWGTPWTDYATDSDESDQVLAFASVFYFGE